MSDIVERLRGGLSLPWELEAAAEIERLRGLVGIESADLDLDWNRLRSGDRRALIADHQDVFDMVTAKENEIERLRQEIIRLQPLQWSPMNAYAEIERLRQEKADILAAKEIVFAPPAIPEGFVIQELQKANVALHADIARLTDRLRSGTRCPHCDELRLELGEARGEIERLREEVKLLNSFRPDAELARLREALEFVLEAARWHFDGDADPKNESPEDMTAHINGLIVQRVREALGE